MNYIYRIFTFDLHQRIYEWSRKKMLLKTKTLFSIIITTLAAKAYCGENNLFEALSTILTHMADYIEIKELN